MVKAMRKNWVLGAFSMGTIAIVAPAAHADGRNEVQAVTFAEANGVTTIRIRGSEAALFTAYKLERPARVVIDLAQSRLAELVRGSHETGASFAASTWAVSSINAQQIDDGGALVRMTINLARPGRYDVKMDGNDLLLTITARDAAPKVVGAADVAAARAEAEAAKRQGAATRAELEAAKLQSAQAAAQAETAKRQGAATRAELEAAKLQSAQAAAQAETAKRQGVATRAELEAAKLQSAQAAAQADAAKRQGAATRAELEAAKLQGAQAQAQAVRARTEADRLRVQAAELAKRAQLAEQAATQAHANNAGNTASDKKALAQAQADAAQARNAALQAARTAEAARSAASIAAADAETAKQREAMARTAAQREVRNAQADASAARDVAAQAQAELAQVKLDAATQRAQAEKMVAQANARTAQVEAQTAETKRIADQAKAALDTASAREKAAQAATEQAQQAQRAAVQAERAAKSTTDRNAVAERDRLAQEATAAQQRVAVARAEMVEAKREREAAAREATVAKAEVQKAKQQLAEAAAATAAAEQQRAVALTEAQRANAQTEQAERRRAAAEALAATAGEQSALAVRTRSEAEAAAQRATATRTTAERATREASEQRAQAELAAQRAQEQRTVAELAASKAQQARLENERGIVELTARKAAMAKADEQARRQQVDARNAEADLAAAVARKASQSELAQIKAEAATARREAQQAQADVAKRTAALTIQQTEVDRLKQVATAARDAADREDQRRTKLADERVAMERETARLQQAAAAAKQEQAAAAAKQALAIVPAAAVAVVASKPVAAPVAAPAPVAKATIASITDVRFEGDENSGRIAITVRGDVKLKLGDATARRAELLIDDSQLAATLERKLDVSRFDGPVRSVASYRDRTLPNRVRVVVELSSAATPTLERNGNVVRWNFVSIDAGARSASTNTTRNIPPPVMGGFGVAIPAAQSSAGSVNSRRRVFRGPPVTLDFKEAPIHDLLRLLSELNRVNIVVPDDIADKVTVRMNRVPWDQALEVILSSKGLWYRREGNLYRIAKRADLDAEDEKESARRKAAIESESPEPEVLTLNYASASELKTKLEPLLSPKGKIEVDERTNSLIVNDLRSNRQRISSLALQLDTQTPQISIEARIVEARSDFKREFGVQWGGGASAGVNGGNATGLLFPSSIAVAGGARDNATNSNGLASPSDFAVNLPARTGTGSGGALGLSLGSIGGNFNLGLRLSALEDSGTVRIISAPKITVLNNESANIAQGVKIPIQVTGAAGTQTSFVDAKLELKVKPYVSQRDCAIAMDIEVTKNEADFVNTGARGDPTILTKEVKTKILINDGETTVLGGIYTRNTGLSYNKVPFFGDLPVIGWFFKKRSENDNRSEVLIFITPKITNKAFLRCQ